MKKMVVICLVTVLVGIVAIAGYRYLSRSADNNLTIKPDESVLQKTGLTVAEIIARAEGGDVQMQYNLAQLYDSGEGIKVDRTKAAYWLLSAAEQGLPAAQMGIGAWNLEGKRIPANWDLAIYWLTKAAEQDYPMAQMLLAAVYLGQASTTPPNFTRDRNKSFYWMLKAAKNGFAVAQYEVARMYIKGIGTNADSREGVSWLTKSAKNGWRSAMRVLGDAYEQGALG